MRKQAGWCLVAVLVCSLAFASLPGQVGFGAASTEVTSIINSNTTWTKAGSPYELHGPVAILPGATLTIEAGATVNFNTNYLQVNGTLIAKGTSTQRITFNNGFIAFTPDAVGWDEQTNSGSIIENADFTQNYDTQRYRYPTQLTVEGACPKLSGLKNVDAATIADGGGSQTVTGNQIWHLIIHGAQTINDNDIDNLEAYGAQCITHNELRRLYAEGTQRITDNAINGTVTVHGSCQVSANSIEQSLSLGGSDGSRPVISYNTIKGGLAGYSDSPLIWSNDISYAPLSDDSSVIKLSCKGQALIENNHLTGLVTSEYSYHDDWYGVRWVTAGPFSIAYGIHISGNAQIKNNAISGCTKADVLVNSGNTTIASNSLNGKGIILNSPNAQINYNNFHEGGGIYLWGKATGSIDATNNWWGTTNTVQIDDAIYDYTDDFNLGKVTYEPFLNAPNPDADPVWNLPVPTPLPSPTPTPTSIPTATPGESSSNFVNDFFNLDLELSIIIVLVVVAAALAVVVVVLLRTRRA
jgi:hypothetical protein